MELRGYAICATPRSGSNYLSRLLTSTGALGRPIEWFNCDAVRRTGLPEHPTDRYPDLQLEAVKASASPNGVYGVKLFPDQADRAKAARWATALPGLQFVHLWRRDLLAQAISLYRASATLQWTSQDNAIAPAAYSADDIQACLGQIGTADARWRAWFARCGLRPLELVYEDLENARGDQAAVDQIAQLVRVPGARIDFDLVDLERQRDETTEVWRRRFLAERGDCDVF